MTNVNIRVQIIWCQGNIIGLWFNAKRIWEDPEHKSEPPEKCITTTIILPFIEATKLTGILINGMACNKMGELKEMRGEQNKNLEDVEDW